MHKISDFMPDMPGLVKISKRENLLILKLIQIFIDERTFNDIFLNIIFAFLIVIFNVLSLLVIVVVEVPDSMAEVALMAVIDTQPSEIESTEWFFLLDLILLHLSNYYSLIIVELKWVERHFLLQMLKQQILIKILIFPR